MVDAISKAGVGAGSLAQALGGDSSLGKEAFLKLLVAQLKNQDPLKPQDNTEFVAELAQFTSLEQTMGINDRLDTLSVQQQGLANTEVVSLVGKSATVRGNVATLTGTGAPVPITFSLSGSSAKTDITITDQAGREITTLEVGPQHGGLVTGIMWNGTNDEGVQQPPGRYNITVKAKGANDEAISVTQEVTGLVDSVSFSKGFPEISLENGLAVPVADLLRVESPPTNP